MTSFGFNLCYNPDKISYYQDASLSMLGPISPRLGKISGSVNWPNYVAKAPHAVFGMHGVVIAGGFLVPTKTDGGIWFSPRYH